MNIGIIIPAAGRGKRFGSDVPKQYHLVDGISVLSRTVSTALSVPNVTSVVLAVAEDDPYLEAALQGAGIVDDRLHTTIGDVERQYSIQAALGHSSLSGVSVILVHDAVRPLASIELFARVAEAAAEHGAVIPVIPVTDTIKRVATDNTVVETVPRSDLRRVQTPQGFTPDVLRAAYDNARRFDLLGTDDASLVEAAGGTVHTVDGESWNIKVTTAVDIALAEAMLEH